MKLSDYVADFIAAQGIKHAFVVTGGASLHLIHSVANHDAIEHICPGHEQGGAMSADAYARITGNMGCAIATSGPGGTNMITGICSSYYDSVPMLYITGQVATFRLSTGTGVRQLGFQETDIVSMCQTITKYAVMVTDPKYIRYELEKAVWHAREGRPGPVLVDIPDNLQREQIEPDLLEGFTPPEPAAAETGNDLPHLVGQCLAMITEAKRPVMILGWGIRLAGAVNEALALAEKLRIPVLPTWGALDMVPADHPLLAGSFGTHGSRHGNFAVQNADLVLSIGSRLDTHGVGSPFSHFARGARKIMVDIDAAEIEKFKKFDMTIDLPVCASAYTFLAAMLARLDAVTKPDTAAWCKRVADWVQRYPQIRPAYRQQKTVNPYVFVEELSRQSGPGEIIAVDTGCAVAWMSQAFAFKPGQRYFHAFNNTPMGYAVPGAIGASLALGSKPVICVVGDGSLQMNIQELATVARYDLPIKIFLLNNHGYSMIQQTQDQWLNSRYIGSSVEGGLGLPDFLAVAKGYGLPAATVSANADLPAKIAEALAHPGAYFLNVEIASDERVIPQVKFGRPIEDSEPLLSRDEFMENMIVEPVEASRR